jgi:beta-lactamase regulating signal transducer with metallopeptidase domain
MASIARQLTSVAISTLIAIIWILITLGMVFWFYSVLRRIEKTVAEIKKLLEGKQPNQPMFSRTGSRLLGCP